MSVFTTRARLGALALCLSVAATACASAKTSSGPTTTAVATVAFPVSVPSGTGSVTVRAKPVAIVSLSPTATETLFAIGAGPQVVAVDDQSNYPSTAPKTQLSGFKPNVEAIAAKKPDLVVIADDTGGVAAALAKIGIPVIQDPAAKTLDDAYAEIDGLGTATGHHVEAQAVIASMRSQIAAVVSSTHLAPPPRHFYYELDQTFYSATSSTFIGQLFKLFGAQDIADAADKSGSGYPQLSAEYVVQANPDAIFLADTKCCAQTKASVSARPGWSVMTAVKAGHVVLLDDDIASRWGPRVVDLVRDIAAGLST